MSKSKLLTVRHVCALIGVSRATLDRWIDDGTFPSPKVMRRWPCGRPSSIRWHVEIVMEWLEAAKTTVP